MTDDKGGGGGELLPHLSSNLGYAYVMWIRLDRVTLTRHIGSCISHCLLACGVFLTMRFISGLYCLFVSEFIGKIYTSYNRKTFELVNH